MSVDWSNSCYIIKQTSFPNIGHLKYQSDTSAMSALRFYKKFNTYCQTFNSKLDILTHFVPIFLFILSSSAFCSNLLQNTKNIEINGNFGTKWVKMKYLQEDYSSSFVNSALRNWQSKNGMENEQLYCCIKFIPEDDSFSYFAFNSVLEMRINRKTLWLIKFYK